MPDELTLHPQYLRFLSKWMRIADCIAGEETIKEAREKYLPYPLPVKDASRNTQEIRDIYEVFLVGAHFVEYTSEAVEDLVSAAFRRPMQIRDEEGSEVELPESLVHLNLASVARDLVAGVGAYGRYFMLVDYPSLEDTPTKQDDNANKAYISLYTPLDIIDWEETYRSGESELTRVVLRELTVISEGTQKREDYKYRDIQLKELEDGGYAVNVTTYTPSTDENGESTYTKTEGLLKAAGKLLDEIPGLFVGTTSNTPRIDKSPVIGIANSNIKHYQTWAELMHTQTMIGHPHLVISGLPPGWNKQAEDTNYRLRLDAGEALTLEGDKSKAALMQIDTNNLIHFRTLEVLEQSMFEQGARIKAVSRKAGVESAQALKLRSSASMSKLAAIVVNVEEALAMALSWAAKYMGEESNYKPHINKEFYSPEPDGNLLGNITASEVAGTAPRGTTIQYLKQIELADAGKPTADLIEALEPLVQPGAAQPDNSNKKDK